MPRPRCPSDSPRCRAASPSASPPGPRPRARAGAARSARSAGSARQEQLIAAAEKRLGEEMQRLEVRGDEQRQLVARLRSELMQAARDAVSEARAELDAHSLERRRALTEVEERLRSREKELGERIEREAVEAARRIPRRCRTSSAARSSSFERIVSAGDRALFRRGQPAVRGGGEDGARAGGEAARPRARPRRRDVRARLAVGARRAPGRGRRLRRAPARDAAVVDRREPRAPARGVPPDARAAAGEAERDLRERTRAAIAEGEAQRDALERRVAELARRIDTTLERDRARLAPLGRSRTGGLRRCANLAPMAETQQTPSPLTARRKGHRLAPARADRGGLPARDRRTDRRERGRPAPRRRAHRAGLPDRGRREDPAVNEAEARLLEEFGPFFSLVSTDRPARGGRFTRLRRWLLRGL